MSVLGVALGLMQMDVDGNWKQIAADDWSGFEYLELTEAERALLRSAAAVEAEGEVSGFGAVIIEHQKSMQEIVDYCTAQPLPPDVGKQFGDWATARGFVI